MSGQTQSHSRISVSHFGRVGSLLFLLLLLLQVSCANQDVSKEEPAIESKKSHPGSVHHSIDYIEFSVTDMKEAKAFYQDAFQWEFNDYGPNYAGIKRQNGESGGLTVVGKVTKGGPLVVLYSTDLESTFQSVKMAGGKITKEIFNFPGGRRFHFQDPSGNELAVWALK